MFGPGSQRPQEEDCHCPYLLFGSFWELSKHRITFKRRPVNHPYSFLIHQLATEFGVHTSRFISKWLRLRCKTKAENALAQALGIAEGQTPPAVVIRQAEQGQSQDFGWTSHRTVSTCFIMFLLPQVVGNVTIGLDAGPSRQVLIVWFQKLLAFTD